MLQLCSTVPKQYPEMPDGIDCSCQVNYSVGMDLAAARNVAVCHSVCSLLAASLRDLLLISTTHRLATGAVCEPQAAGRVAAARARPVRQGRGRRRVPRPRRRAGASFCRGIRLEQTPHFRGEAERVGVGVGVVLQETRSLFALHLVTGRRHTKPDGSFAFDW